MAEDLLKRALSRIESGREPETAAAHAQELILDLFCNAGPMFQAAKNSGSLQPRLVKAARASGNRTLLRHYQIPDDTGEFPQTEMTERYGVSGEGIHTPVALYEAFGHSIVPVQEGELWQVHHSLRPLLVATVRTCSVLVAAKDEELLVAHTRVSSRVATEKTLEFFDEQGIARSEVIAIVCVGRQQILRNRQAPYDILFSTGEYRQLGVSSERILPFKFEVLSSAGVRQYRNIVNITVLPTLVHAYRYSTPVGVNPDEYPSAEHPLAATDCSTLGVIEL